MKQPLFDSIKVGNSVLKNRIVRSGTFEGMCDGDGVPTQAYLENYKTLAACGAGAVITGFVYTSPEGRAIQPGQGGMDHASKVEPFSRVTKVMRDHGTPVILQICHTGRQTRSSATGFPVVGASSKRSIYFRERPRALNTTEVDEIADQYGRSAQYAREAGFDAVQIHAAHGYLVHQFLHGAINNRRDRYGVDPATGVGTAFLEECIRAVRKRAGDDFPIWVKVSWSDDFIKNMKPSHFEAVIACLDRARVSAIEVSYGTMDYPMSIFRGDLPSETVLAHNLVFGSSNPFSRALYKSVVMPFMRTKHKPFSPRYNFEASKKAAELTKVPVFSVGGFRSGVEMNEAIKSSELAGVSLCRPILRENKFILKLENDLNYKSDCTNCNVCAVMCDSSRPTRCYGGKEQNA